jgi:hypothetical protein
MNGAETSFDDLEIEDLLALFARPDLSLYEAEQVIARLQPGSTVTRERIVDRLLAALEASEIPATDREPGRDTRRVAAHDAALVLLAYLGDETVVPRLLTLLDEGSQSDDLKLKLISIIHEFDPDIDPEDLLGRLRNPYKAVQRSHREHLRRLRSPLELGLWLDVMAEEMLPEARASFARSSADVADPSAVPVLICLCYDEDPDVALSAMDAVERYKDARALPALEELAERHPDDAVRSEARKTADRLRIRAALVPQAEPLPPPPPLLCYLTTINGDGGQMALLVRESAPGMLRVAQTIFVDETGIERCLGLEIPDEDLDDLLDELADQGLSPVDVSQEEFFATLDMACEATWKAERSLPGSFVAWREWITWEWTHLSGYRRVPVVEVEPSDETRSWGAVSRYERDRLLDECPELLFQDEFADWFFDEEEIGDLAGAFWALMESEGQQAETSSVRALLREAVRRIVTDHVRALIRDRLRRVAPLLRDLYVDDEVWRWAVVAADALADDSPLPPEEHPLLLAMAAHGLENVVGAEVKWRSASD